MSPALQADSLPTEPPGKPKNTGVGCNFLLHEIVLTHLLNLLHWHVGSLPLSTTWEAQVKKSVQGGQ